MAGQRVADTDSVVRRRPLAVTLAAVLGFGVLAGAIWTDVNARNRAGGEAGTLHAAGSRAWPAFAIAWPPPGPPRHTQRASTTSSWRPSRRRSGSWPRPMPRCRAPACTPSCRGRTSARCRPVSEASTNALPRTDESTTTTRRARASGGVGTVQASHRGCRRRTRLPLRLPRSDVILDGQTYYAYATNSVAGNIQMIESSDLAQLDGDRQRTTQPPVVGGCRPHLGSRSRRLNGHFRLYYAVDVAGTKDECISVATSDRAGWPFHRPVQQAARVPEVPRRLHRPVGLRCQRRDAVPRVEIGRPRFFGHLVPATRAHRQVLRARVHSHPLADARSALGSRGRSRRPISSPTAGATTSSSRATTGTCQLRRRRRQLHRPARPLHREFDETDSRQRGRRRRAGRRVGLHRRHGQLLHRLPRVGAGVRRLPEQPGPLHPPPQLLGLTTRRRGTGGLGLGSAGRQLFGSRDRAARVETCADLCEAGLRSPPAQVVSVPEKRAVHPERRQILEHTTRVPCRRAAWWPAWPRPGP